MAGIASMVGALSCLALVAPASGFSVDQELSESESEPTPLKVGEYTVTPGKKYVDRFFQVERTTSRSSMWVGITNETTGSTEAASASGEVAGDDSKNTCGDSFFGSNAFKAGSRVSSVAWHDSRGPCLTEDRLNVEFSETEPAGKTHVVVWEEPPVENRSILPPPSTKVSWDGKRQEKAGALKFGDSFATATEVKDGEYTATLTSEATGFTRVDLDWGEHLEVSLELIEGDADMDEYETAYLAPVLWSPLGGEVKWAEIDSESFATDSLRIDGDTSQQAQAASPTIQWRNREAPVNSAGAFPGTYYLTFGYWTGDEFKNVVDSEFLINVRVVKDDTVASPYTEDAQPVPTIGGHTAGEGGEGSGDQADAGSSGSSTPWGGVIALFGGSAVMTAAGVVLLGRHRKLTA